MRKNNIIKIAEIGLNHLGSEVIAKKYLNYLINTNVDGISFQIKNEDFNKKFEIATNIPVTITPNNMAPTQETAAF